MAFCPSKVKIKGLWTLTDWWGNMNLCGVKMIDTAGSSALLVVVPIIVVVGAPGK